MSNYKMKITVKKCPKDKEIVEKYTKSLKQYKSIKAKDWENYEKLTSSVDNPPIPIFEMGEDGIFKLDKNTRDEILDWIERPRPNCLLVEFPPIY